MNVEALSTAKLVEEAAIMGALLRYGSPERITPESRVRNDEVNEELCKRFAKSWIATGELADE